VTRLGFPGQVVPTSESRKVEGARSKEDVNLGRLSVARRHPCKGPEAGVPLTCSRPSGGMHELSSQIQKGMS
jgi:hypothetical protein